MHRTSGAPDNALFLENLRLAVSQGPITFDSFAGKFNHLSYSFVIPNEFLLKQLYFNQVIKGASMMHARLVLVVIFPFFFAFSISANAQENPNIQLVDPSDVPSNEACERHPDCKPCVEVCIDKKCVPSGKILCPGGNCVHIFQGCKCTPPCKLCEQYCAAVDKRDPFFDGHPHLEPDENGLKYVCKGTGMKLCPNGDCVEHESGLDCDNDCDGECKTCVEECDYSTGECKDSGKILCDDGITCLYENWKDNCPNECEPPCAECIQGCFRGECNNIGNVRCPDGTCAIKDNRCPSPKLDRGGISYY